MLRLNPRNDTMQIQMQAFAKRGGSLRKAIADNLKKNAKRTERGTLYVAKGKNMERAPGWLKIKGVGLRGVLNVEWDAQHCMLKTRAIAKQGNKPAELLGLFVAYLLERHQSKLNSVSVQVR